jgi:hypothetical protein
LEKREIPMEEILSFSNRLKIPYIETSAKNNIKVDDCFFQIVNEIDKFQKIELSKKNEKKNEKENEKKNSSGCIIC